MGWLFNRNKNNDSKKIEELESKLNEVNFKYDSVMEKLDQSLDTPENIELERELKEYRLRVSREQKVKAYIIFNNRQMEDLIKFKPISNAALLKISGFGDVKIKKYGDDIINIIRKY